MKCEMLICAVILQDRITNAHLRKRFGIQFIENIAKRSILHWLAHVELKKIYEDWMREFQYLMHHVEGKIIQGVFLCLHHETDQK